MEPWVLIVTWLFFSANPTLTTYQVEFWSEANCETARERVIDAEFKPPPMYRRSDSTTITNIPSAFPVISAVCVQRYP